MPNILPYLLAKAVEEILPRAHVNTTYASGYSFEARFSFPTHIDSTILAHIEAKMRYSLRNHAFEIKTYLTSNAMAFLEASRRSYEAQRVCEKGEQFTNLITIDNWVSYCSHDHIEPLVTIPDIALIEAVSEGQQLIIRGIFGKDKKELNSRVKYFKGAVSFLEECKRQDVLLPYAGRALLLAKGQEIAEQWRTTWKEHCMQKGCEFLAFCVHEWPEMHRLLHDLSRKRLSFWGYHKRPSESCENSFLPLSESLCDYSCCIGDEEMLFTECTSALHFIRKIYTLFPVAFFVLSKKTGTGIVEKALNASSFSYEKDMQGANESVELVSYDCRGRLVPLARVEILVSQTGPKKQEKIIAESCFLSVERTLALAIEQHVLLQKM